MKRFLAGLVVGAVLATGVSTWAVDQQVKLFVDGREIAFADAPPQMINGRTMVPARPLVEALGAKVSWDQSTYAVKVTSSPSAAASVTVAATPVWTAYPEILTTLQHKYPDATVAASASAIRIGETEYLFTVRIESGKRQADVSALLAAGVLATADIQ